MKKFLCLIMTIMMMVLPVLSYASVEEKMEELLADGRQIITTITTEPGKGLTSLAGDKSQIIDDLYRCFNFIVKKQTNGEKKQITIGIDLDRDQNADADIVLLIEDAGICVSSALIDQQTLTISFQEINNLLTKALENIPGFTDLLKDGLPDISSVISKLIEKIQPVMTGILSRMVTENLSGDAEGFENATVRSTVRITKKDLDDIGDAIADSFGAGESLISFIASLTGKTIDSESVKNALHKMGESIQSDIIVELYSNDESLPVGLRETAAIGSADDIYDLSLIMKMETEETIKTNVNCTVVRRNDNTTGTVDCSMSVTDDRNMQLVFGITGTDKEGKQEFAVTYSLDMSGTKAETSDQFNADVCCKMTVKDLLDMTTHSLIEYHADIVSDKDVRQDMTVVSIIGDDLNAEPICTVKLHSETADADPYLEADTAKKILQLENEDFTSLTGALTGKLYGLIMKLPKSILQMMMPSSK